MLDVAHMAVHIGHLTALDSIRACYDAVTVNAAKILHLEKYGITPGCRADLVLLQAADPFEAIRLKATRLLVMRRGKVIARTPEKVASLNLSGRPGNVTLNFAPGSVA
jgi:cytosine/creatinine deaminase